MATGREGGFLPRVDEGIFGNHDEKAAVGVSIVDPPCLVLRRTGSMRSLWPHLCLDDAGFCQ